MNKDNIIIGVGICAFVVLFPVIALIAWGFMPFIQSGHRQRVA